MCTHPKSALRTRYVTVRGYRCRHTYCNDCKNAHQREHRALRKAFRMLATLPVTHV